jgi:dynein heavy chain, axonemal
LAVQKIKVTKRTEEVESLLKEIAKGTAEASEKKELAIVKSKEIEEQTKIIDKEKGEAEVALIEAMPALEAAKLALEDLKKEDIIEIRVFKSPPLAVEIVCSCIVIFKGIKEVNWKSAQALMADTNFLGMLKDLDVNGITNRQIMAVKGMQMKLKIIFNHFKFCLVMIDDFFIFLRFFFYAPDLINGLEKNFDLTIENPAQKEAEFLKKMVSISRAGAGLLKFVYAVIGYTAVYREVKPKKDKVFDLNFFFLF